MLNGKNWLLAAILAGMPGAATLDAQDNALTRGESEVTVFAGLADGEGTFGGAFGKAVTDRIFVLGEMSYIAGGSSSSISSVGQYEASANALNFNGTLQYNFTNVFKDKSKFVPYAAAGLGITRVSASASGPGFSSSASDSSFLFNFGGGLRYYVKPNWGLRPELMVFAGNGSYARFAIGLFYQF